jgi:microcystin-dependent protein
VAAGKDDMGGTAASRLTNTVLSASNTLGATGGSQTHTLTSGESGVPAHSHANTLTNNAVNTGNNSVGHTHSGTTNNDSPDHTHSESAATGAAFYNPSGGSLLSTMGGGSTGGASARHTHSFTTGGISVNHTHSVTSNVTISNVNNSAANAAAAHTNTQPTIVLNYIIKI